MKKANGLTLDEWKEKARNSPHVLSGEIVTFNEDDGIVSAIIRVDEAHTVFLGNYFLKSVRNNPYTNVEDGFNWLHE